jgi:hypothetical protein
VRTVKVPFVSNIPHLGQCGHSSPRLGPRLTELAQWHGFCKPDLRFLPNPINGEPEYP